MNRLEYWCRAKTQYNIHSPFMFDLYSAVLFARMPSERRAVEHPRSLCERRFHELRYKFEDYFSLRLEREWPEPHSVLLEGDGEVRRVMIVCGPHKSRAAEREWALMCADEGFQVSVDMFDVGVLIANSRLHRQHFILR